MYHKSEKDGKYCNNMTLYFLTGLLKRYLFRQNGSLTSHCGEEGAGLWAQPCTFLSL